MILKTHSEPAFSKLILELVPRIARLPAVKAAMRKYTSGFLNDARLEYAVRAGTLPTIELAKVGGGSSGNQEGDALQIDRAWFKYYKQGHPSYVVNVPITVFHELAHWGYWKGQRQGYPSDEPGQKHNSHGDHMSPLNKELQPLLTLALFNPVRPGMF